MKRDNYINFCNKDHVAIGASETIPNLTLPVHELMERLTDHTLDDIKAKSLLYGEYFPVGTDDDIMKYADKLCLAETCIDLTDVTAIKGELQRQINVMLQNARQAATKPAPTSANATNPNPAPAVE